MGSCLQSQAIRNGVLQPVRRKHQRFQTIDQLFKCSESTNQQDILNNLKNDRLLQKQKEVNQTIRRYESKLDEESKESLNKLKQQNKLENGIQVYLAIAQDYLNQNRQKSALRFLENVHQVTKELKLKGVYLFVDEQVQLLTKLTLLEAARSQKYKQYLDEINQIFSSSLQYFLQDKIALINNLALAVQQSDRGERFKQSIQLLKQSLRLQQKYFVVKDQRIYYTKINLAAAYYEQKQYGSGFKLFDDTINELENRKQKKYDSLVKIAKSNFNYYQAKFNR